MQVAAIHALGRIGSLSGDAWSQVLKAATGRNRELAREAITAFGMIGPAAKDAIPTLDKLTEHEDRQIAERAKAALRQVRGR